MSLPHKKTPQLSSCVSLLVTACLLQSEQVFLGGSHIIYCTVSTPLPLPTGLIKSSAALLQAQPSFSRCWSHSVLYIFILE